MFTLNQESGFDIFPDLMKTPGTTIAVGACAVSEIPLHVLSFDNVPEPCMVIVNGVTYSNRHTQDSPQKPPVTGTPFVQRADGNEWVLKSAYDMGIDAYHNAWLRLARENKDFRTALTELLRPDDPNETLVRQIERRMLAKDAAKALLKTP
jgi:hypothetical protein